MKKKKNQPGFLKTSAEFLLQELTDKSTQNSEGFQIQTEA